MSETEKAGVFPKLQHYVRIIVAVWTVAVILSLIWNLHEIRQRMLDAAIIQAKVAYEKELIYRQWNTDHGGVYAEVTKETPPNPYLFDLPERDITTPSGKRLTMVNPAYMTRQANEIAEKKYGIRGHLTSLNVINPDNAPDPWEKNALLAFLRGEKEVASVEPLDGEDYMRLMQPLVTEKSCLGCHATQGHKEGDIRGGISISVPMGPLMSSAYGHMSKLAAGHLALWFMGIVVIGSGGKRLIRSEKDRLQMVDQIRMLSWAVKQNPSSVIIADRGGRIEYVNPIFTDTMGYRYEEILGRSINMIKSEEHPPEFYREIWDTVTLGEVWRGDVCSRKKNGDLIWELLSISPIRNAAGEITNIVAVKIDDTERRRAEYALWKSEEKFRSISASAQDAIIMKDNDGKISFWNMAAEKMFGYTESEALGKNLHSLISPGRYHDVNMPAFEQFRKTGKGRLIGATVEVEALRKDGSEFPIELSISAVKLDENWSAIGIVRDITERKDAEANLRTAKESAEKANRSKSEFLATMSHELRTPLNAIIGFSEILLSGAVGELNGEQKKDVGHILSGGHQLLNHVNDILDISKIEAGRLTVENFPFILSDVINNVLQIVSPLASRKSMEIQVVYSKNIPMSISADAVRLRQIILNLMGNAVKFTSTGQIVLSVEFEEANGEESILRISVQDTGIGIPEEQLESIFEKFTQADPSTTRKYGGTGLGLAISKKLVELMGGAIGVSSIVGVGSTFWFKVPVKLIKVEKMPEKAGELPEIDGRLSAGEASCGTSIGENLTGTILRVLVVDDNLPNQEIAHKMLNALGCHVDVAGSGKEAEVMVDKISYDLIFLDCHMPEMDGYEVTSEIRKGGKNSKGIPIIAMTAKAMEGDYERCLKAGMNDYMSKPLSLEALSLMLSRWGKRPGA